MTACGGNFIGGEISRNKQSPKELRRLRLRMEEAPLPRFIADLKCSLNVYIFLYLKRRGVDRVFLFACRHQGGNGVPEG